MSLATNFVARLKVSEVAKLGDTEGTSMSRAQFYCRVDGKRNRHNIVPFSFKGASYFVNERSVNT